MKKLNVLEVISLLFGLILLTIGIMNILKVHPVPGIIYITFSIVFFPPTKVFFKKRFNFTVPFGIKTILFIIIMWFTLGVSDLAEMYGL
ncbi:hypothetical protein [Pontimicrobium sp. SW4]|uniref:Uncharacterized protein n=1 Tax=Pontimicrobium sp. SW4 TaxID=3153519 RepID=A0AAU7BPC7_9FLAO